MSGMTQLLLPISEIRAMAKLSPQCKTLLSAFERGERLTVATAIMRYGVYALSQRCGELHRAGYPVESRTINTESGKHVSEYWIA